MRSWFRRKVGRGEQAPEPAAAPPIPEETAEAEAPPASDDPSEAPRRSGARARTLAHEDEPAGAEQALAPGDAAPASEPVPPRRERRRRAEIPRRSTLPPVRKEMLISIDIGEQRVAVLEDGQPVEIYLERPGRRSIAGNIYKGIVDNVLPGMEASFIEIGLEKNGFLYVDEIVTPELEGKRHGRRIQDLIARGQQLLVQAVKDPMGSKGARLTTEISLPGRFVVYTPYGDGVGVSRRLDEEERERLKKLCRQLDLPEGGIIVRTAAEGASEEELAGDLAFLQKLWSTIQARAERSEAPALVYREAELPLRVVRDLFLRDFEHLTIDHERTYARIVSYLKRTSPALAEKVELYRGTEPLMERYGVDAAVRSTLDRRVDLPSGGYLIFDYAEAFTVIDVNTGRFVGARGKSSTARLEDTITKNNLEATKEIVRQLRLRDIGGIIVIDFIDMANPKNRLEVEEALKRELERDRTKTYVVEISPLGLVEMTRQNVTEGPREILTCRCPVCHGDGVVVSDETYAVEAERALRRLARESDAEAFVVEIGASIAGILIGPAGSRLAELERETGRMFVFETREDVPKGHVELLRSGSVEEIAPMAAPVAEGQELRLLLEEENLRQPGDAIARLDGYVVSVAGAAKRVGKRVTVRIERVTRTAAYAVLVGTKAPAPPAEAPVEAGVLAEEDELAQAAKPARRRGGRRKAEVAEAREAPEGASEVEAEGKGKEAPPEEGSLEEASPKRRTRRGSRGGRDRRKAAGMGAVEPAEAAEGLESPSEEETVGEREAREEQEASEEPRETRERKPRTRRGTRGGRGRRKATLSAGQPEAEAVPEAAPGQPELELAAGEPSEDDAKPSEDDARSDEGTVVAEAPKRRTRRGSRGGQGRKRATAAETAVEVEHEVGEAPPPSDGVQAASPQSRNGDRPARRTRRSSRGGRGRKRAEASAVELEASLEPDGGPAPPAEAVTAAEPAPVSAE